MEQPLAVSLPVCAVVLGALALTAEYSSGMIRTTLAAVRAPGVLFMAKAGWWRSPCARRRLWRSSRGPLPGW